MLNGTYDFKKVSLVVGTRAIGGFEEGSEIMAARNSDSFTKKTGPRGDSTRSATNDKSGRFTFTLNQMSDSNQYLQNLANLDEISGNGVIPVKVVDKSNPNVEQAVGLESWVVKPADKGFGNESGPREWVIECDTLDFPTTV